MNIQHFEKGLSYNASELLIFARKISKLADYCETLKNEESSIRIETERRATKKKNDEVKVMITVTLPRETLRSESRRNRMIDAFDRAVKKLVPQLKRYKEMHTGRQAAHEGARKMARAKRRAA